jgi:hypothetical protein
MPMVDGPPTPSSERMSTTCSAPSSVPCERPALIRDLEPTFPAPARSMTRSMGPFDHRPARPTDGDADAARIDAGKDEKRPDRANSRESQFQSLSHGAPSVGQPTDHDPNGRVRPKQLQPAFEKRSRPAGQLRAVLLKADPILQDGRFGGRRPPTGCGQKPVHLPHPGQGAPPTPEGRPWCHARPVVHLGGPGGVLVAISS